MHQLSTTYTMTNTSHLQNFRGDSDKGNWRLKASDHASYDQEKLNRWALKITRI